MTSFIRLHPKDDVLIARVQLVSGTLVEGIPVKGLIPPGHQIAEHAVVAGDPLRRYNQIIGFASRSIATGEHVHTHNLDIGPNKGDFERDYAFWGRRRARASQTRGLQRGAHHHQPAM